MLNRMIAVLALNTVIATSAFAAGALAIDENQGDQYGFAYGYDSLADAQNRALSECGGGCSIVENFANSCAAYAADQSVGSSVYGWGVANSGGQAQSTALQYCANNGGAQCIVRVWGCDGN